MTDMMLGEDFMHNLIVFTVSQRLQTRLIQKECANSGISLMSWIYDWSSQLHTQLKPCWVYRYTIFSLRYWLVFYLLYCGAKSLSDNMHWNDEYTLYITESLSSLYPGITFHLISSELWKGINKHFKGLDPYRSQLFYKKCLNFFRMTQKPRKVDFRELNFKTVLGQVWSPRHLQKLALSYAFRNWSP